MDFPSFPRVGTQRSGTVTRGPLLATEKVHGAQLVLEAGRAVRFGKRKAWLADDEPFFGWQLLRASLTQSALTIRSALGEDAILYGELFGGAYPHAAVPPIPRLQAVQTGVWYSPDLHWAADAGSVHRKGHGRRAGDPADPCAHPNSRAARPSSVARERR